MSYLVGGPHDQMQLKSSTRYDCFGNKKPDGEFVLTRVDYLESVYAALNDFRRSVTETGSEPLPYLIRSKRNGDGTITLTYDNGETITAQIAESEKGNDS